MDRLSKQRRIWNISRIQCKNTLQELQIIRFLYSNGLRYRVHASMPGKPDLVFPRKKICVFISVCFWHMHKGCKNFIVPKTNTDFWMDKIQSNFDRYYRNYELMEKYICKTTVVLECVIEKYLLSVAQ